MKRAAQAMLIGLLISIIPATSNAQQFISQSHDRKEVSKIWKKDFETFCTLTQSDDCITVDSRGFWWDSEPSLKPKWIKMNSLPIKTTKTGKVAQLGGIFYCSNQPNRRGYLKCTPNGWRYTLYYQNEKKEFIPIPNQ